MALARACPGFITLRRRGFSLFYSRWRSLPAPAGTDEGAFARLPRAHLIFASKVYELALNADTVLAENTRRCKLMQINMLPFIASYDCFGSFASVRQCPPLVRSPTNSDHSWHVQTSLWCDLPVHSKSSNGGALCVLKPRDIPTRCLPPDDFAEPAVPRFQDSLFPLTKSVRT